MTHITKTQIAKKAIHMIVALNVTAVVSTQVAAHSDLDDESITLEVGSFVVGHLVALQTDKYTDRAVDGIIAKWRSRKVEEVETPA